MTGIFYRHKKKFTVLKSVKTKSTKSDYIVIIMISQTEFHTNVSKMSRRLIRTSQFNK